MAPDSQPSSKPNWLAQETSPYLRQHAFNPVDWYPWGDEAFDKAHREDKPIFLSVGYSACHWCHVMERESFEHPEIAEFLNRHYVSIKVDREERPDVDQIYMSAVQLITRRGGWPMSVFLTPEGKPFYGGTYWPPTSRMGMPGFLDLLRKLHDYWSTRRTEVETSAGELAEAIQRMAVPTLKHAELNVDVLRKAVHEILSTADRKHGGFGAAPKFPHPMDIRLLLRDWKRFQHSEALQAALLTLDKMAFGGIYDQLGGGFHRYSTDAVWLVPHFEKMLYDNALLVPAYLEAWQITGKDRYARIVRETLDYVLREMTAPSGGFYSTQDADSEGEEGKFFVWSEEEIISLLGADDARVFNSFYGVTRRGNWEGANILCRHREPEELAEPLGLSVAEIEAALVRGRKTLFDARSRRAAPGRDDKILAAWNGLMIGAMARAGAVLGNAAYVDAAATAARFVLEKMREPDGRLRHSCQDGRARFNAYLDDYACLVDGLVELFQANADPKLLDAAAGLADVMVEHFSDHAQGGFFYTSDDHEVLIARTKDAQDNAIPSGNGMAATALVKLGRLTGNSRWEEIASQTLDSLSGLIVDHPHAAAQSCLALDLLLGPTFEVIVVDRGDTQGAALWRELTSRFLPHVLSVRWTGSNDPGLLAPLLAGRTGTTGSVAYLCRQGACRIPVEEAAVLAEQLNEC